MVRTNPERNSLGREAGPTSEVKNIQSTDSKYHKESSSPCLDVVGLISPAAAFQLTCRTRDLRHLNVKQAHRLMSNAFNKQHPLTYPNVSDRYTVLAKTFQRVWQHWRPLILVPVWCAGAFGLVTVRLRIQKERRRKRVSGLWPLGEGKLSSVDYSSGCENQRGVMPDKQPVLRGANGPQPGLKGSLCGSASVPLLHTLL